MLLSPEDQAEYAAECAKIQEKKRIHANDPVMMKKIRQESGRLAERFKERELPDDSPQPLTIEERLTRIEILLDLPVGYPTTEGDSQ